jgi:hypothetical protein
MQDGEDEPKKRSAAEIAVEAMNRMAARITANVDTDFAGAFVVAPPEGEPIELLLLQSTQSAAIFWSLLQTRASMALAEIAEAEANSKGGWGR